MKQTKFTLADLLILLSAISFSCICFLGSNFSSLGETSYSLKYAAISTIVLFVTAILAKTLKKTNKNFKSSIILEGIMLMAFTGSFLYFTNDRFMHFFNVNSNKGEIQVQLRLGISNAKLMYDEYEKYADNRISSYESKLKSVSKAKNMNPIEYSQYGFSGEYDDMYIATKTKSLRFELYPNNYNETKEIAINWYNDADMKTSRWYPIGIVSVVRELENNSVSWLNSLIENSENRETGENSDDFTYSLFITNVKSSFENPQSNVTVTFLAIALVFYILMILSWMVTKRSTKFTSVKDLLGNNSDDINNL